VPAQQAWSSNHTLDLRQGIPESVQLDGSKSQPQRVRVWAMVAKGSAIDGRHVVRRR
jgi:hypothetical protein